jgi:hypothetical protein
MQHILVSETKDEKKKARNRPRISLKDAQANQRKSEKDEKPFKVPGVFPPTYVMAKDQTEANKKFKKVQNGMDRKIASKNLHMIGK